MSMRRKVARSDGDEGVVYADVYEEITCSQRSESRRDGTLRGCVQRVPTFLENGMRQQSQRSMDGGRGQRAYHHPINGQISRVLLKGVKKDHANGTLFHYK